MCTETNYGRLDANFPLMLVEIWRADQLVPVAIYFETTPQPCNAAVTVELVN